MDSIGSVHVLAAGVWNIARLGFINRFFQTRAGMRFCTDGSALQQLSSIKLQHYAGSAFSQQHSPIVHSPHVAVILTG